MSRNSVKLSYARWTSASVFLVATELPNDIRVGLGASNLANKAWIPFNQATIEQMVTRSGYGLSSSLSTILTFKSFPIFHATCEACRTVPTERWHHEDLIEFIRRVGEGWTGYIM